MFEEKIKKPMELYYLHNTHDTSNVTSMSSLNAFDANDMQSHKLGDAMFYEDDLFNPASFDEQIYFDDTLPPIYDDSTILEEATIDFDKIAIYDDYCDAAYVIKNTYLQVDHDKNDLCDSHFVEFAPSIVYEKDFAYMGSNKFSIHVDRDNKSYVIVILLSLFMMPLKIIMRGEHMLIDISIIPSSLSLC